MNKEKHVTLSEGMSGWFAVIVWWNPEHGGFWEPWDTGTGRYAHWEAAELEAKDIADGEGFKYYRPSKLEAA